MPSPADAPAASRTSLSVVSTVTTVCGYCGVGCGLALDVARDDSGRRRVVKAAGDKQHPANRGRLCTKGATTAEMLAGPGRLETAMVRQDRGEQAAPADVDDAIDLVARRLRAIIDEHGPDAVALYVSGQMTIEAQYLANKLAKGYIGTNQIESNSRLCMASAGSGYKLSLGSDGPPGSYDDLDHADLFFVIGANMADCHPILFLRMMDRVKAGARLIVVDPRRTATADKADLFLQVRAGTDLALLNGLLHLLVTGGWIDEAFIAEFTEGWAGMPAFLADYAPEQVELITGIAADDLRTAARWIGEAGNWMSLWTMGLNQSTHGTWSTNALCNLHLATGAICRTGSGPFSLTGQPNAMGGREMGYMGPGLPGQRSVLSEADRTFMERMWSLEPGALRADTGSGTVDMFQQMADGAIKACWIICTNPVASMANRRTVIAGLERAELVIAQDVFADTETNAYADVVLPGAMWAESDGVMINSERTLTLLQPAADPPGQALPDWQIIARVAQAMGYVEGFEFASAQEVFAELTQAANPATGWDLRGASHDRLRAGPVQWPAPAGRAEARNPIRYLNDGSVHPLLTREDGSVPRLRFATASGRAVFFPRPHMPAAELPDEAYPFVLTTGRVQHQWHTLTKTGRVGSLNRLNPGPFLQIHPDDARELGAAEGDLIEVASRRGRAVLPASVTDRVQQGLCFAPFHWNDIFGEYLAINAVTSDAVDPISFQPELKACAVTLTRVAAGPETAPAAADGWPAADAWPAVIPAPRESAPGALEQALGVADVAAPQLSDVQRQYLAGFLQALGAPAAPSAGTAPTLPSSAPFEPLAAAWINGALAGAHSLSAQPLSGQPLNGQPLGVHSLRGQQAPPTAPGSAAAPARTVLLLWASQTGTAQLFAETAAAQLGQQGHLVSAHPMVDYAARALPADADVVLITSTFGDGEAPDNGAGLLASLRRETVPPGVRFAVLAFGDSSYTDFCGHGRRLDERLAELGAQRLVPRADCDAEDQVAAVHWLSALSQALRGTSQPGSEPAAEPTSEPVAAAPAGLVLRPARLAGSRLLTGAGSQKQVREFTIDLAGSGLTYRPGDALVIEPANSPELVAQWLQVIGADGAEIVELGRSREPVGLAEALRTRLEIAAPSPALLAFAADRSGDRQLSRLLHAAGAIELEKWLFGRQGIDIAAGRGIDAAPQDWVDTLRPLARRRYSIASSPLVDPERVRIAVSIVAYESPDGAARMGVCSAHLAQAAVGDDLRVAIAPAPRFGPPPDPAAPMIMIGPGTGVAPFLGFLQHRRAEAAPGRSWLFFGEQHESTDHYYRTELEDLAQSGALTRVDTAFSRDQRAKVYVQDRMAEHGKELWSWIESGAHVYVCGDAKRMARDVDAALRAIAVRHGGLADAEAEAFLKRLAAAGRYVRDVY